jgi:hypothetical protein
MTLSRLKLLGAEQTLAQQHRDRLTRLKHHRQSI